MADRTLVAFADAVGETGPVAVEGGRTRWDLGGPLDDGVRLVQAPAGVVDYQPAEMTVRVRAGTTTEELAAVLSEAGQRVALPPRGGTVGGAIAVAENDLHRLGRGSVRDALLQVTYIDAAGQVVVGGGPVVKNVSGFNLPKLLAGSLGTLGLIAEVVLRTNPLPAATRWVVADDADPSSVLDTVLAPGAVLTNGVSVWVQLEGHALDVVAEIEALGRFATFRETDGAPSLPPHRWSLRPDQVLDLDQANTGAFVASIGVGTVWAERPQPDRAVDAASQVVAQRMKQLFDPTGRLNPGRTVGW